jgi:aerobic C4-dicarboxylate transport protein
VLIAILLGVVVGWLWPDLATNDWIKALGDGFIKLIKMVIAPIIFCTVVSGIAYQDASKVGRVGVKALVYFEVVSTFALIIGLMIGNLIQPGAWRSAAPDAAAVATYAKQASEKKRRFRPQHHSRQRGRRVRARRHPAGAAVRDPVRLRADGARRARPPAARHHRRRLASGVRRDRDRDEGRAVGAFGAMAYTIGKFGPAALGNLLGLIATVLR